MGRAGIMAEKYRKVDPRIWKDEKFIALSERDKLIFIYCITAQVNRIGIFNFSPAMAAEDVGVTNTQTFRERFDNVKKLFNWGYDETFRVLYIPTWWKYNLPENKNVLVGNLKDLHELPNTPLLSLFYNNLKYLGDLAEAFTQTLAERYSKPSPIQEQEQEQEQESYCSELRGTSEPAASVRLVEPGKDVLEDPPVMVFPLIKKDGEFAVCRKDIDEWQETFPGIDVEIELRVIRQWSVDNPQRRKTAKGIRKHISGWLAKEQDRKGRALGSAVKAPANGTTRCGSCSYNSKGRKCRNLGKEGFDPKKCEAFVSNEPRVGR